MRRDLASYIAGTWSLVRVIERMVVVRNRMSSSIWASVKHLACIEEKYFLFHERIINIDRVKERVYRSILLKSFFDNSIWTNGDSA